MIYVKIKYSSGFGKPLNSVPLAIEYAPIFLIIIDSPIANEGN
jgi:hypothetical protein